MYVSKYPYIQIYLQIYTNIQIYKYIYNHYIQIYIPIYTNIYFCLRLIYFLLLFKYIHTMTQNYTIKAYHFILIKTNKDV